MTAITISLPGEPVAKGRPRASLRRTRAGLLRVHMHTPERTSTYEGRVRAAAQEEALAMRELMTLPLTGPIGVTLRITFEPPASWSRKKREAAIRGEIKHVSRPDIDNVVKAWLDALNGIVYRDDSQIVRLTATKAYGPQSLVAARVRGASEPVWADLDSRLTPRHDGDSE